MKPWENMATNPNTGKPYTPRRWQAEVVPAVGAAMARGEHPLVIATTGSGKSVAQSEVCRLTMARLKPGECIVVSAPSQSLVVQLHRTIAARCGKENVGVYYGRKKQPMSKIIVTCLPSLPGLVIALAERWRRVRLYMADEAHKTETESIVEAVIALDARWRCGWTATPFRSNSEEALSLWSGVCYKYTLGEAIKDGVLVPMVCLPWDGTDDIVSTDEACISMIKRMASGPGIVSATSIADAEAYAEMMTEHGIRAEAVHSRLKVSEVNSARDRLRDGELDAIVHVSLLVEGVDWPWLQWGCLRRPLRASVAFVQQVGRFLRTYPGKTHATILDPHDLMSTRIGVATVEGGDFAARIGAWEQEIVEEELREDRDPSERPQVITELPPPKAVYAATNWARQTILALMAADVIRPGSIGPGEWRTRPASPDQIRTLANMSKSFAQYCPDAIKEGLRVLSRPHASARMQQGAVSDLITILRYVASQSPDGGWQARKTWAGPAWPDTLDLPRLEPGALRAMRRDPETGRLTRA